MARAETIFNTPLGPDQVNPSPESLCDLVLRGGDDFWAAGSGQAALEVTGEEGARLLLMGRDAAGFFLVHESRERLVLLEQSVRRSRQPADCGNPCGR